MTSPLAGARQVVSAIARSAAPAAASATDDAAKVAASASDDAAKALTGAAPKLADAIADAPGGGAGGGGMSGTGWFGLSAGAAGLTLTLLDAWKDSFGSQRGITAGQLVNPSTVAIGGGAVLLTIGEKAVTGAFMKNGMRSAGIALVLGGLVGAISGAVTTFGDPLANKSEANSSTQSQAPVRFGTALPPTPAHLEGLEVASADVIGEGRKLERVSVYVDPTTATAIPDGATLGEAIGQARAATQADSEDRSHAVVQTADGAYWVLRLSGQLDQVDGRNYSKDTKFDDRYDPQIGRRQMSVQAIAGVEGHYVFPQGTDATAPVQYTGDIPWVAPTLPASPAESTPTPTPTPEAGN